MKYSDLEVGDAVVGPDGWTRVVVKTQIHPRNVGWPIEVTFLHLDTGVRRSCNYAFDSLVSCTNETFKAKEGK